MELGPLHLNLKQKFILLSGLLTTRKRLTKRFMNGAKHAWSVTTIDTHTSIQKCIGKSNHNKFAIKMDSRIFETQVHKRGKLARFSIKINSHGIDTNFRRTKHSIFAIKMDLRIFRTKVCEPPQINKARNQNKHVTLMQRFTSGTKHAQFAI